MSDFWPMPHAIARHAGLTAKEKLIMAVILALARTADGCYCSNDYLAKETGATAAAVKNALVRIRKKGFLKPHATPFPKVIDGARLIPTEVSNWYPRYQNDDGEVSKRDTDREGIGNEREKPGSLFTNQGFPDPSGIAQSIAGYDKPTILAKIEDEYRLNATTPDRVKHWPSWIKQCLDRDRDSAAILKAKIDAYSRKPKALPEPKSQFSRSY